VHFGDDYHHRGRTCSDGAINMMMVNDHVDDDDDDDEERNT